MSKHLVTCLALLFSPAIFAEDTEIAKRFAQQAIEGTIVISSVQTGETFIHNDTRANRRLSPASTFKILNTLISLEEHAISGKDDLLIWDGKPYDILDWNRDQTLESAFKVSCVWCYQELARRVGAEKYRSYIGKTNYGELREPFDTARFWLDGSLEISAAEQVEFLKKVYRQTLPFAPTAYETLSQIMITEQTPDFTLRAKTGWATRSEPQIGWYVGYAETPKDTWIFAMNIDIRDKQDLPLRQKLTKEALQIKGLIK